MPIGTMGSRYERARLIISELRWATYRPPKATPNSNGGPIKGGHVNLSFDMCWVQVGFGFCVKPPYPTSVYYIYIYVFSVKLHARTLERSGWLAGMFLIYGS